ncbi:MAG: hypothetical protein WBE49_01915 [Methylovirgula sp.]
MTDIPILNFDKDGVLESELPPVGPEITDVVLLSHGWHEEPQSAIGHYGNLVGPLEEILAQNPARWQGRRAAYFGVIWPSDEFADDLTVLDMRPDVTGPPPAGIVAAAQPLSRAALEARARDVAQFLGIDADLLAAQALQAASDNEGARDTLLSTLQSATATRRNESADDQTKAEHKDAFDQNGANFFSAIEREFQHLSTAVVDAVTDNPMIEWLKRLRGDTNAITAFVLNNLAYNEMKIRARLVGRGLADHALEPILARGKRVHLVGHSFGGRLMTAAAAAVHGKVSNLTLLESAFSQNALSRDVVWEIDGAFRSVIDDGKVTGLIVAAHSGHDAPVWIAYPLASRAYLDTYSLQPGKAAPVGKADALGLFFGGPTDPYGAMGANGPQNLDRVSRIAFDGTSLPALNPGVHSLDCTSFVAGHNDVWKQGSAYIVASGLLL